MKIAFLSHFDARDRLSWSGSSYYLAKALSEIPSVSLDFIGPLRCKSSPVFTIKYHFYRALKRSYFGTVDPAILQDYARQAASRLADSDADFVLSLGAVPMAYLQTEKPIVYYWDSTFLGNLDYPLFRMLAAESITYGHRMEQMALDRCRFAVFSSDWAVQTAQDGYRVDRKKLKVAPIGANLDCNRTSEDVTRIVEARPRGRCNLLFIGVDWIRKGGNVAYAVAKELNDRGLNTTLTIIGCDPEVPKPLPPYVNALGFINKAEPGNQNLIERLLSEAHFLVVPSIAESFGAVFSEASSFGTPSLARRTGGVTSAVRDEVNGRLFATDAPISDYCNYILHLFADYSRYQSLALSSFAEYQARLSWRRTSETIVELFRQIATDESGDPRSRVDSSSMLGDA